MDADCFKSRVDADSLRKAAAGLADIKQMGYDMMDLSQCGRVLDVGCGAGLDLPVLAGGWPMRLGNRVW